jgi:hypothetical protein
MKKFLFTVGILALAGSIFVGGLVVGTQLDFMNATSHISTTNRGIL